ncbi:MAG: monovalent cation/H(+) antiporter subunit G [Acidimicrobiia bacterium]
MIGQLLMLTGSAFILLSAVGAVRFPEVLARMHALAKASTFGIALMLIGAAIEMKSVNYLTSIILALILHVIMSPPASNMLGRATYMAGAMPEEGTVIDEGAKPLGITRHDPKDGMY